MPAPNPSSQPTVSVIVPARNEEACIGACLESLVSQQGIRFEIIVVDDGSSDRTCEIAGSFPGLKVVKAGLLPSGWIGKNNALVAGARTARGEWLLFTDADTVHLPGSLTRSFAEAQKENAALLSYSPEQQVHGFWEKAIMPVIFAELAARYRPSDVSDPESPAAAANGQYLLITRRAYDAVGGHAAIAGELLEDVALARAVKASGRKISFRYGADAVRTRMYRSFAQLKEGWTKNLALLFPSPARLAVWRMVEFLAILAALALALVSALEGHPQQALVATSVGLLSYSDFLVRIRKAHFKWDANLLALLGLPTFSYLLFRSLLARRSGAVIWKGRRYPQASRIHEEVPSAVLPRTVRQKPLNLKASNGLSNPQS